ncbi:MAG: hypothetical protein PHE05_03855 [Bacilli bacterium]|nr:hypothetical protein [Bacilli bacterium]
MNIPLEELRKNSPNEEYKDGYRAVYFYDNHYSIGTYCKTIEGFMIGFAECEPIMFDDEIPEFVSIDDLLDRFLNDLPDAISIGIYDMKGNCIAKKTRNIIKER